MRRPPFRADHVGSLLRPTALTEARAARKLGDITATELQENEDEAIRAAVAKQESIGLQSITDGEMRRAYWHLDFVKQIEGVSLTRNPGRKFGANDDNDEQPPIASIVGRLRYVRDIMVEDFKYLKDVTKRTAKMTIPSPTILHLRGGRNGISRTAYPDIEEFWADAVNVYRRVIQGFHAAGCTYLQLDDVGFSYLCDENFRETCIANGDDPATLPQRYVDTINAVLKDRPADMTVTMHTCRGNFRSSWVASGGYESVADTMFRSDVDGFFMEFDNERSGGFEPLGALPKNKRVVLGLVTTKLGEIESKDKLKRRIDQAARFAPLDNLCLSPQCGFSSTHHGNNLSLDEQWRKLELVVEVAQEIWGDR